MKMHSIYQKKYWWTLQDFYDVFDVATGSTPLTEFTGSKSDVEQLLGTSLANLLETDNLLKPYIKDLFNLMYARFYDHYIFSTEHETIDEVEDDHKITKFRTNLVSIILQTYDRYAKLLDLYTAEKNKLLDGVKTSTTGTGQFNDTPQNVQSVAEAFGDNSHVSNITKSTAVAESDVDTKINRLEEIARKFRNLLKEWTNEFESIFIEEGNI